MLLNTLIFVTVVASVKGGLKGTNNPSKNVNFDLHNSLTSQSFLNDMRRQWPHEKKGYTLGARSGPSADSTLQNDPTVDILQLTPCGSSIKDLDEIYNQSLSSFSLNEVVNVCRRCSSVNVTQRCEVAQSYANNKSD